LRRGGRGRGRGHVLPGAARPPPLPPGLAALRDAGCRRRPPRPCAADAVRSRRRSLLAVGISRVEGTFPAGVPVDLATPDGEVIARGLTSFSSDELRAMAGRGTGEARERLGERFGRAVIHRDQLVVL